MFVGRGLSHFHCSSGKKSVLKPLVSTVHPLQKDNSQGTKVEQRSDSCILEQLHSSPKRRKTCRVTNVTSPTMSRVVSPVDKKLFKSMSALSITANSMLILMFLKSKRFVFTCSFIGQKTFFFFFFKVESV